MGEITFANIARGQEISEVSADWAHRWATFHTGDGDGTRVFLRVSAEVEKRKVKEMEAFLLEWQGSEFQSLGLRSIGWTHAAILIALSFSYVLFRRFGLLL